MTIGNVFKRSKVEGKSKRNIRLLKACCILVMVGTFILYYAAVVKGALAANEMVNAINNETVLRDLFMNDQERQRSRRAAAGLTPTDRLQPIPIDDIDSKELPARRLYARTLVGILVDFSKQGLQYRRRFRQLFPLHPNVCSIGELQDPAVNTLDCELVYTFVVGAGMTNSTSTMPALTNSTITMRLNPPFLVPSVAQLCQAFPDQTDCMHSDMTLLNIAENMNLGKSPTWFAYGAHIAKQLNIDYIAKQDTDTILYLDKYFRFCHTNLPPAPFATDIFSGWFDEKTYWPPTPQSSTVKVTKFTYKSPITLYVQGQFYLMSSDLAAKMAKAIAEHPTFSKQGYIEEHEDRDVSSAVLLGSDKQLHFILLSKKDLFWQHRVKVRLGQRFHNEWGKELARIKQHVKETYGANVLKRMGERVAANSVVSK